VYLPKGGLGKDKSVETRRGLHVVCDGERVVEDGVHHVKTERTRVGGGRLPSDIDQVTNRSGCRCIECQCRHERGGEGSKCTKGVIDNTSETCSSTATMNKKLTRF
jgi:hypothetical protein